MFLHIDSISIGHKINLSLLDKTSIFKNIQILKQWLWKRWREENNLNYLDFISHSLPYLPLMLQTKWHPLEYNFYWKTTFEIRCSILISKERRKGKKTCSNFKHLTIWKHSYYKNIRLGPASRRLYLVQRRDQGTKQCCVYIRCCEWS